MTTEILRPVYRDGRLLRVLDQRLLPGEEIWLSFEKPSEVALAIREMVVRGAPSIGVAAAYGAAFAMRSGASTPTAERFETARRVLGATRPTAVNLFASLDRMARRFGEVASETPERIEQVLVEEADSIADETLESSQRLGRHGSQLLSGGTTVLTHCNAGGLATGGYGSALGVIRAAIEEGKAVRVLAPETRPFLQGSRLTAWELAREGIPVEVITDSMSGHYLSRGEVAAVVVGADRIAANGDTANKIGTYSLAVLAKENGVPFYVAAPTTTVDLSCPDGSAIPIEERSPDEVLSFAGHPIAPAGVGARHPAFDVTPARYIAAIVTDEGICRPPYADSLAAAVRSAQVRRHARATS
ncbi:MAG TPA: S-methyl-5-thioribose-1-phosphate isomerase [Thermoanaerobaculia bacterium]|nr:S-methyl-5-thioribose-1-phosphate isomerase [Thermoanaerobaculia bacterium]